MRTELPTFKHRGISLFVQRALCASGGHVSLAASSAAQELGVPCMIFLPHGVDARTQAFLRAVGANVVVSGRVLMSKYCALLRWLCRHVRGDGDGFSLAHVSEGGQYLNAHDHIFSVLLPAYDYQILWGGQASMITEIQTELPRGVKPAALLAGC
ncbi:hypothetical protein BGW80DRAFT_839263 [Lactifluus volemus]|nr:hypothetical protein BGW80DRAFT_839263 [Lactifluus volemus]